MRSCSVIVAANRGVFIELANALAHSMNELGFESIVYDDVNFKYKRDSGWINIVLRAFRPFEFGGITGKKILFQTEELHNRRDDGYYDMGVGYDRVLELYKANTEIPLGTHNVVYCPIGYSPAFETDLPEVEEDIDVLFYGSMTDRRKEIQERLNKMGMNILFVNEVYGKERDELIMRSKIVLNVKAYDQWCYGPLHCILSQCKKKFTLTEKGNGGYGPFVQDKHFIEYDGLEDLEDSIWYWVKNDKERNEFAVEAYENIKSDINFTEFVEKGLKGMI
jgi:hypothetical protein